MGKNNNKKRKRKNFKTIMKSLWNQIKTFFVGLYLKFKKLPKKLQKLISLWVIIFLIIIILIFFCGNNRKVVVSHEKMEEDVAVAALDYVKTREIYPTENQKMRLNINTLLENGDLYDDAVDKSCIGYALIYYDETKNDYDVKAYLSCKNYETDGYPFVD